MRPTLLRCRRDANLPRRPAKKILPRNRCVAILRCLRLEHAARVGAYLGRELDALAARLGPQRVVEARGKGLLRGLELTRAAAPIVDACRERGLLIISAGAQVLRFAPPLIIEEEQIDQGLQILEEVLRKLP